MRNTLLRMLATLLCVLAACANVIPVADFDMQKMSGKWYVVGLASNAQWYVANKAVMKMATVQFVPTAEGDFNVFYANMNADGTCWRKSILARKTDTPGRFTYYSQVWSNDNDMRIVDVLYDEYALVNTIKTQNGESEVLNELYGRSPVASATLEQKFRQFSQDTGILPDNINILPKNTECPDV